MAGGDHIDDVSAILADAADGGSSAADRLLPLVYEQLRHAAAAQLAVERPGHTLSATAMVHEAYLRLAGPREIPWANRAHFYAAAAEAMRRILIDDARAKAGPHGLRGRRGGSLRDRRRLG